MACKFHHCDSRTMSLRVSFSAEELANSSPFTTGQMTCTGMRARVGVRARVRARDHACAWACAPLPVGVCEHAPSHRRSA
eukprot:4100620-Pleurochrysis_carterae.AAC.1